LKLFNYFWLKIVKVDIENPVALHFIMQDELFFLKEDKEQYANRVAEQPVAALVEEPVVVVEDAKQLEFAYTGAKGELLILVHYPDLEFIDDGHLAALENILKRKGLAVGDVAILNMAKNTSANFASLSNYFNPPKVLILGERSLPEGVIALALNQPKQTANGTILFSYSFDEMMDSPENKKAFWEQMKNF